MCNLESPDLSRLLPNHVHIQQQTFLKQQNKNQSNNKKGRMEGECVLNEAFYLERMLHQGCMWEVTQGHQLPSQLVSYQVTHSRLQLAPHREHN